MRIVCEACEIAFMVIEHFLLLFLYIYNYIFFFAPKAYFYIIFQCWRCFRNPAPGRMRYAYIFIVVRSEQFRPTIPPTVVGIVCVLTPSESGLSPLDIVCTP